MQQPKDIKLKYYKPKPIKITKEQFKELKDYIFGKNLKKTNGL